MCGDGGKTTTKVYLVVFECEGFAVVIERVYASREAAEAYAAARAREKGRYPSVPRKILEEDIYGPEASPLRGMGGDRCT